MVNAKKLAQKCTPKAHLAFIQPVYGLSIQYIPPISRYKGSDKLFLNLKQTYSMTKSILTMTMLFAIAAFSPILAQNGKPQQHPQKEHSHYLEEVEVKATRIQMTYHGDTIVYDASAFVLPEGSMLEALVRQMPGANIDEAGNIFIHGKQVNYLTLNGKDFFKGKNKLMLENLPYYTVKDIKVYDKDRDMADQLAAGDGLKKDYVMDVKLKREYQHSYLTNTEVGGGTKDRWMARFFSLFTGERNTMTLFANANKEAMLYKRETYALQTRKHRFL